MGGDRRHVRAEVKGCLNKKRGRAMLAPTGKQIGREMLVLAVGW
ncbi:MAG: hypothetical protein SOV55_05430 [Candidatus Borkfalkiaceae bacterium]|nr:hypothetical protein [Christensenellaceae bacterium]